VFTVVTGEISQTDGLREALELVLMSKDVKNGLLRIVSKDVSGRLGIFCGRFITGAQIASTGELGLEAAKKLLAVRQGMFAFLEAKEDQNAELKQSLQLDIHSLLEWAPADGSDRVGLEEAVEYVPKVDVGDSLMLVNAADQPIMDFSIPGSEAVFDTTGDHHGEQAAGALKSTLSDSKTGRADIDKDKAEAKTDKKETSKSKPLSDNSNESEAETGEIEIFRETDDQTEISLAPSATDSEEKDPPSPTADSRPVTGDESKVGEKKESAKDDTPDVQFHGTLAWPTKAKGGFLSKLAKLTPTTKKAINPNDAKDDKVQAEEPKPQLPMSASTQMDERTASQVFGDLEKSMLKQSGADPGFDTRDGATSGSYNKSELDSIPTPAKSGEFDKSILDSIPTPGTTGQFAKSTLDAIPTPGKTGDSLGGSKHSREAQELFQNESQRMLAVDPKQFLSQTGQFKKTTVGVQKMRSFSPGASVAAGIFVLFVIGAVGFIALQMMGDPKKQALSTGNALMEHGHSEIAVKEYTKVIEANPEAPEGYMKRAAAYFKGDNFEQAAKDYSRAIALDSNLIEAYRGRAQSLIKSRNYEEAIKDLAKVIEAQPGAADVFKDRGTAYMKLGKYKEAVADLDQVFKLKAPAAYYEAHCDRAFSYIKLGDYKKAIADYTEAIGLAPGVETAYLGRSSAYTFLKDYKNAIADSDKALALVPGSSEALYRRGLAHQALGNTNAAIADYDKAIQARVSYVDAYIARGKAYLAQKKYATAMTDFNDALTYKPNHPEATALRNATKPYMPKAKVVSLPSDVLPGGSSDIDTAGSSETSNNPAELMKKGYRLLQSGNPGAAIPALSKAVRLRPSDTTARRYLAHALLNSGQVSLAADQFGALAATDPGNTGDRMAYGDALLASGRTEQAISAFESMIEEDEDNQGARLGLARSYASAGFFEKCRAICRDGIRRGGRYGGSFKALMVNPAAGASRPVVRQSSEDSPPPSNSGNNPSGPAVRPPDGTGG
jgi:tetratricopeptide (TPR) repeat protein